MPGQAMKIAYFTAGDRGAGHFMRGLAVLRGLARAGFQGTYRMFGPQLPFPAADRPDYEVVPIHKVELQDRDLAQESELARALRRFDPDLVLVDLFWAPLLHVLPTLRAETWLLLRDCPPVWLVGPERARFDAGQYARIIAFEPIPTRASPTGSSRSSLATPTSAALGGSSARASACPRVGGSSSSPTPG